MTIDTTAQSPDTTAADTTPGTPRGLRHTWQRLRQKRWFRWSIDLTIFALLFAAISLWQGRNLVGSGQPAPDFTLPDMQGQAHALADYQGKKTFVVFWAPWCPVCGAESDNISRVKSWMGERIHVTSVVLDYQSMEDVQKFVDKHNVDYPVLLGTQQVQQDYRISAYPTMYVLDKEGKIDATVPGYTTTLGMLWRALF